MKSRIIPTIFAHNKKEFQQRFEKLLLVSKNLQIDFMDGKFVKAKSISLEQIPNLTKYKNNFEAHLMLYRPEKYIEKLKQKGFKKIIFHIEATKNPEKVIKIIKKEKLIPFIAINPVTALEKILPFLPRVRGVLFMGVYPGKENQSFIQKVYKKIFQLKKINKKIIIQVDGGVNFNVTKKLANLGVNYINSGSFISASENPRETLNKLNHTFDRHKRG